jgi:hypothetical protein
MQSRSLIPAAILCFAASCLTAACQTRAAEPSNYSISVDGAGNRVIPHEAEPGTLFEVRSTGGIGSAGIEQTAGATPPRVVIRLYLKGLEEFSLEYGQTVVTVSVASHGEQRVSESMRTAGSAAIPIGPESPYSMPVRVVTDADSEGQSSIAYFEVDAPLDYIQGQNRAFDIRWIDFYR